MSLQDRILIVDDEAQFVRMEERVLRDFYLTRSVQSGEAVLNAAREFHPDLVLLDINMPEMDGYETCRRIRKSEESCFLKIIMISGKNCVEERVLGYRAGADDYICKPFDTGELLAKIHVYLRLKNIEEVEQMKSELLELTAAKVEEPRKIIRLTGDVIDAPETPDHIWPQLGLIFRNAVALSHFVDRVARLDMLGGKIALRPCRDSLREHLFAVFRLWEPAIQQRGLKRSIDCDLDLMLCADWQIMDEVFGYLLDNAVRYSDQGQEIVVSASVCDDRCEIHFRNRGRWIHPAMLDGLFTPFSVDDLMHHHEGHGLSLAIAHSLVGLHGGNITATSGRGRDTVFTISLPVK